MLKQCFYIAEENYLVFVNFFAPWCRFSHQLAPIYEDAFNDIRKQYTENNSVVFGIVNCDQQREYILVAGGNNGFLVQVVSCVRLSKHFEEVKLLFIST